MSVVWALRPAVHSVGWGHMEGRIRGEDEDANEGSG